MEKTQMTPRQDYMEALASGMKKVEAYRMYMQYSTDPDVPCSTAPRNPKNEWTGAEADALAVG